MHSAVEEVAVDPCDLYLDLGALIVEGRIPGLTDRGFGEGPHCPPTTTGAYAQQPPQCRHHCNPEASECQRYEQMKKHMLLLWKNGIPMSIEVLLYPNCCTTLAPIQNVDTSAMPDMSFILLEQWTVHMLPRRVPDASIHPRGLLQAIRSFLYFSQLCAWFSLTGGESPQNVHYRVCVPGEAFSSRFAVPPETHVFPIANVGRNAAMKVLVKSQPRCGEIPAVICNNHSAAVLTQKMSIKKEKSNQKKKEMRDSLTGAEGEIIDGVLPTIVQPVPRTSVQSTPRTSSPADTMLGESLLDPPNSLCMYPKRYQSPSRCGSPSLEVPEHLMFGKGSITKRETQRQRMNADLKNRSRRSHQKSVTEGGFKKPVGESLYTSTANVHLERPNKYNYLQKDLNKETPYANIDLTNYFCYGHDLTMVPKAEMETVLHRLRSRGLGTKTSHDQLQTPYLQVCPNKFELLKDQLTFEKDLREAKNYSKLPHRYDESNTDAKSSAHFFTTSGPKFQKDEKMHTDLPQNFQKYSKTKSRFKPTEQHSEHLTQEYVGNPAIDPQSTTDTNVYHNESFQRVQGSYRGAPYPHTTVQNKKPLNKNSKHNSTWNHTHETYQLDSSEQHVPSSLSGVNIKKCGTLLQSLVLSDKLIDERGVSNIHPSPSFLQKLLKSSSPEIPCDEFDPSNCAIPSAEKKAQFRRSLDSATSLVFHKKSGLPLTSSPAPIRKSGTCFDFDSSLTSVSAIKRALFEKEPEDGEIERLRNLPMSISAPSSMTVSSLLGTFEESVLNGRLEPVSTVEGFTAEIGASGSFCPRHITLPVTIFFYTLQDIDKVTSPYLGHINLGKREYHIPKSGTVQVTLFNPHRTVVKMFVVRYDLRDMPPNCQTFLRQRTLYMPTDASDKDLDAQKWLRYLIHLRFFSSKSGRIYLHTDVRMIIFRKSDLDAATVHGQRPYELRSFTQGPINPKFSPRKP